MLFENPILRGCYPDPSVCRVGSDYYLVTSSFTYFPAVPIFHSRDLVNWRQLGHCLDRPSQLNLEKAPSWGGVWAPTIRFHEGTFYMTTTNVASEDHFAASRGNFIVTAKDPAGTWSDPMIVDQQGIDPSLFFDDDGSVYYTTSHGGALQSRIDIRTGAIVEEPRVIWSGTGGKHPEGPHLYKRGGYYYLLISEGGTEYGHMITVARSRSPWGPFEECARNPILSHRSKASPIQGTGHADLVDTPAGKWFAVALAFRPQGYPPCYHLGRETFLCPVTWEDDGFPAMGEGGTILVEHECTLPRHSAPEVPARDDFSNPELDLKFNTLRQPSPEMVSLTERPGHLRLRGSEVGLDDVGSPAWVGRRQGDFKMLATTSLEFLPSAPNEEAGLVVRMNEKHHYSVFLTERCGARVVVLRRRIGSLVADVATKPISSSVSRVIFRISADENNYAFFFGPDEERLELLGKGECRYLATEVAGGFTGVYLAMYSTGNGAPCRSPADFDWFEYRPLGD